GEANYDKMSKQSQFPDHFPKALSAALSHCNPCQRNRPLPGHPQFCRCGSCNRGEEIWIARTDRCCGGLRDHLSCFSPDSNVVAHVE
ncbi:hypothetical protein GOODEAATRI_007762, partial [Goodea atripinnis]